MQKSKTTKQICFNAVMVAVFMALELISLRLPFDLKITLNGIPIILSALYFGPLVGGTVGLLGSFLSQMLTYGFSATTFLWVLPAVIRGVSIGVSNICFKKSRKVWIITIEIIISSILVTAFNTLALIIDATIYGYNTPAVILAETSGRLILSVITAIIYSIIIPLTFKPLDKILK